MSDYLVQQTIANMQEIIDQSFQDPENQNVSYGGFWQRFGAIFLDGLILSPITFGISYFNMSSWKNPVVFVVATVAGIAYKPWMEYAYGATLGKRALNLEVTNTEFGKATLQQILLRNIFHILPNLITLFLSIGMFSDPDFQSATGFDAFGYGGKVAGAQYLSFAVGIFTIIDAIVLATDAQKRSIHDMIGGTLVIEV